MRKMRSQKYLSTPEEETDPCTLSGDLSGENVLKVKEISDKIKIDNILKIIKNNDFFVNLCSWKIDIFENDSPEINYEEQIRFFFCKTQVLSCGLNYQIILSRRENLELTTHAMEADRTSTLGITIQLAET